MVNGSTRGHGIHSQYRPAHLKEWINRENRRLERSTSPESTFSPENSLHRASLHKPDDHSDAHIEHRHHATSKSLAQLSMYKTAPPSTNHIVSLRNSTQQIHRQPVHSLHAPHKAHHHHFGWTTPTPEARIGVPDSTNNHRKMGGVEAYSHYIHSKASKIISRRV